MNDQSFALFGHFYYQEIKNSEHIPLNDAFLSHIRKSHDGLEPESWLIIKESILPYITVPSFSG